MCVCVCVCVVNEFTIDGKRLPTFNSSGYLQIRCGGLMRKLAKSIPRVALL